MTASSKASSACGPHFQGIVEGGELRRGLIPGGFLEQHVVGGVGVERRVQVDQVNTGDRDMPAENLQVVAEIELVLPAFHAPPLRSQFPRPWRNPISIL